MPRRAAAAVLAVLVALELVVVAVLPFRQPTALPRRALLALEPTAESVERALALWLTLACLAAAARAAAGLQRAPLALVARLEPMALAAVAVAVASLARLARLAVTASLSSSLSNDGRELWHRRLRCGNLRHVGLAVVC